MFFLNRCYIILSEFPTAKKLQKIDSTISVHVFYLSQFHFLQ